jgi:hypothetical protein
MAGGLFYRGNGCGYEPSVEKGVAGTFRRRLKTTVIETPTAKK